MSLKKIVGVAVSSVVVAGVVMFGGPAALADGIGGSKVQITGNSGVKLRSAPTTKLPAKGNLAKGTRVAVSCWAKGPAVQGNSKWYLVSPDRGWISAKYARSVGSEITECPEADSDYGIGKVVSPLNVRSGPSTGDRIVGSYAKNSEIRATCYVRAQTIKGNSTWYYLGNGWVSAKYVVNASSTLPCSH